MMRHLLFPAVSLLVLSSPSVVDAGIFYGNPVADNFACQPGCMGDMVRCLGRCEMKKDLFLSGWMVCGHSNANYCKPACPAPRGSGSPYFVPSRAMYQGMGYSGYVYIPQPGYRPSSNYQTYPPSGIPVQYSARTQAKILR